MSYARIAEPGRFVSTCKTIILCCGNQLFYYATDSSNLKFSIAVKDLQFYSFILSIVANKAIYISVRAIDKKSQALISYHQPEHIRCINLKSGLERQMAVPVQRVV
ncbi:hypothetical protein GQX74_004473 [Glossina fuscipes]|nr:hypothetical protein GQX74_004473 [Glossina fuscipes]